jgi:ribosomal protein S18 acetylase RimI-like enzyme
VSSLSPSVLNLDLKIRRATPADAERLADLAARTFYDSFAVDNRPEDMAVHTARSYSPAIQVAEINDPAVRTLLVKNAAEAIAYTQLRFRHPNKPTPACVTGPNPCEIWRFYIDRPWIGRGVAQRLMSAALDEAKSLGAQTLWLGVWEKNPRAIAFYRKCGFTHVGEHSFLFADDMQTDLVMARSV